MKKRLLILMTVTGMIILLGGLLTYGLGVHEIIPVPRPDLIVVGTSLIGILLIVSGVCDLFVKKTKEMEIEENDERNISLSNAAMASGFKVMNVTIAVSIFALIFTGYMTVVPCFTIIGAYWSISFLLLATLGTAIYIPIYSAFRRMVPYAAFHYPVISLLVVAAIVLLVCLATPVITFMQNVKQSVVERLRQN